GAYSAGNQGLGPQGGRPGPAGRTGDDPSRDHELANLHGTQQCFPLADASNPLTTPPRQGVDIGTRPGPEPRSTMSAGNRPSLPLQPRTQPAEIPSWPDRLRGRHEL